MNMKFQSRIHDTVPFLLPHTSHLCDTERTVLSQRQTFCAIMANIKIYLNKL